MNRLAYLLAGMVVGAAGMVVARKVKDGELECSVKGLVQGSHDVLEKALGAAETLKEDVEDFIAESKYIHEEKLKAQAEAQEVPEPAVEELDEVKPATKKKTATQKEK